MTEIKCRIVQISDTHISPHGHFVEESFNGAINDVNKLDPQPDIVIHTGDVTDNGVLTEYELAVSKFSMLNPKLLVTPGNHDEKNFGNSLFKEMIGPIENELRLRDIAIIMTDSPQPDRDEGRLGRRRQTHIEERLDQMGKDTVKILVFHHHLISVPFSGREQAVLEDAGDVLDMVLRHKINMVLMGHRHVRRTLQMYNTVLVNAGTVSSIRTRGRLGHSYNLIDILDDKSIIVSERNITQRKNAALGVFTLQPSYNYPFNTF